VKEGGEMNSKSFNKIVSWDSVKGQLDWSKAESQKLILQSECLI
jgi:hypothetical protein